ncbi:MAG: carboxypeptidase-like regulatory domain-containing protein [Chitinophagales bacterium]
MIRRLLLLFFMPLLCASFAYAQTGEIQGKVTDAETGETIPFVNVSINISGNLVGTTTDFDGIYSLNSIRPGAYTITFSYVGFQTKQVDGVQVNVDKTTFLNAELGTSSEILDIIEVVEYKVPLLQSDQTSSGQTVTSEQIKSMPTRNVNSIAGTAAGVFQADENSGLNVKGAREEATDYYIDGIKVRGTSAIPATSIEQLTVVTGGVPARYGDATGGIINITTKGPSTTLAGGLEVITSEGLDPYGYRLGNFSLSGPILKANKGQDGERAILGFFMSGEYLYEKDDDPSAIGTWKVKDDVLQNIIDNPLSRSETVSGFQKSSDFVTFDDLEKIDAKNNVAKTEYSFAGKVDFQPVENFNFTLGGNFNYNSGGTGRRSVAFRDFMRRYELFDADHSPEIANTVYRVYGRFTQRFANREAVEGEDQKPSVLQNAFYSLQFDYTKALLKAQDPIFEDRLFEYGYAGQFNTYSAPNYAQTVKQLANGVSIQGWELQGFQDTLVTYTPSDINPVKSRHNEQYFLLAGDNKEQFYQTRDQILLNNGILNGPVSTSLSTTYNLWYAPGNPYGVYQTDDSDQYRLTFNGAFDLRKTGASDRNKHSIQFGFEYEQRVDRSWLITPNDLWTLADQLIAAPQRGLALDKSAESTYLIIDGERIPFSEYNGIDKIFNSNDTITYDIINTLTNDPNNYFDRTFRQRLGFGETEFIDPFNVTPDRYSLDMFSADELYRTGGNSGVVDYYGYDYLGNKSSDQPTFEDFWRATDPSTGIRTRPIDALRPIYMAGYIQDKFYLKDLLFNIGLRVDRFDANIQVPKDKFSPLYGVKRAAEVTQVGGQAVSHPSTIGEDFVVYGNADATDIVGYRNGDQWYDENGEALKDPRVLLQGGSSPIPFLIEGQAGIRDDDDYNPSLAFEDYEPQVTFMPRISFSFDISDEAIFFAHYDVLSQRPQDRFRATPDIWYFFEANALSGVLDNPNLKPERTIDYQIGFKQKLTNSSALTLSGFYRELKDMVQVQSVPFAYPNEYSTYANIDFGTVKGLEVAYDLRRSKNVQLTANYTLQFAEGTGSGDRSQANLIQFGQPNLRAIFPLSYDSRHMLNLNFDFRYGEGKNYNGPKIGNSDIFANAGLNLIVRGRSGTPYTQQANATPDAQFGVQTRPSIDGTVNGARLPWSFRMDARLEKDFKIVNGKKEGKSDISLNAYLLIQNVLDAKNIINVYDYTGSPLDDGYVSSPDGLQTLDSQVSTQAFLDQYYIKVQNPNNYSIPRRIRLGLIFGF